MKYRPVLTEEEVHFILLALQQYSEDTEEIVALIRKLDLLLYRAQAGNSSKNGKKAEPKKSALAAMLAEKYASFSSFQEAQKGMEAADIAIALQAKPPTELSKEEINFIGKYIIGGQ